MAALKSCAEAGNIFKVKEIIPRANIYVADKGMEIELNKEPF